MVYLRWSVLAEDEAEGDAQQGERLDHGEADPDPLLGQPGRLGLARRRLDVGGEDDADTDAGADGGEAVPDGAQVAGQFGEDHVVFPPRDRRVTLTRRRSIGSLG